jgi:hypothetical protein
MVSFSKHLSTTSNKVQCAGMHLSIKRYSLVFKFKAQVRNQYTDEESWQPFLDEVDGYPLRVGAFLSGFRQHAYLYRDPHLDPKPYQECHPRHSWLCELCQDNADHLADFSSESPEDAEKWLGISLYRDNGRHMLLIRYVLDDLDDAFEFEQELSETELKAIEETFK